MNYESLNAARQSCRCNRWWKRSRHFHSIKELRPRRVITPRADIFSARQSNQKAHSGNSFPLPTPLMSRAPVQTFTLLDSNLTAKCVWCLPDLPLQTFYLGRCSSLHLPWSCSKPWRSLWSSPDLDQSSTRLEIKNKMKKKTQRGSD